MQRQYYVYIMTNKSDTVLYTGVTNDIARRASQHKSGEGGEFSRRYNLCKLLYYEVTTDVHAALAREKQLKAGSRKKKVELITGMNPTWKDLAETL